jgi:hypothetical protein
MERLPIGYLEAMVKAVEKEFGVPLVVVEGCHACAKRHC